MTADNLLAAERRAQDLETRISIFCEQVRDWTPSKTGDANVDFLSDRMAYAMREWVSGTMADLGIWRGDKPKGAA